MSNSRFFASFIAIAAASLVHLSCTSAPDLTARPALVRTSPHLKPVATVSVNVPVEISVRVANIGNAGTVTSFECFFQEAENPDHEDTIEDLDFVTVPALDAGMSTVVTLPHIFRKPGRRFIRACADKRDRNSVSPESGAVIAERDEGDNCSHWALMKVTPP